MSSKRIIWPATIITILLIGAYFLLSGQLTSNNLKPKDETSQDHVNFRLKWVLYSSFASHLIAEEKGFFSKENIDVNIRAGGAGLDTIKLVASGEDDIGLASYGQILTACNKGIPVVAVAQSNITSGVGFVSLKDSNITSPDEFIGKTVGWIPGSDTGSVYAALMSKLNIDREKIDEVTVGFSVDPLLNGAIDVTTAAFVTNQPIFIESKGIEVNVIDPKDYGVNVGGNVFFATKEYVKNNPELIKRFLKAALKGSIEAINMQDEDVVNLVIERNPALSKDAELKIWHATKEVLLPKTANNIGLMPDELWQDSKDVFANSNLISKELNLSECYTNKFVPNTLN